MDNQTVAGRLIDSRTIFLDAPVEISTGPVSVHVVMTEPIPKPNKTRQSLQEWMLDSRKRREAAGYRQKTAEEIDAIIAEMHQARGD